MPNFLFDTNVLVEYLRDNPEAEEALMSASEMGRVLISRISIYELWSPQKWTIVEKSENLVQIWVRRLNLGELPSGLLELVEDKAAEEHDFELPSVLRVEVISENKYWVIIDDTGRSFLQIQHQSNELTIGTPDRRKREIEEDIKRIYRIADEYNALIIDVSQRAQIYAEVILAYHSRTLGKNAITDALIIGSGLARRAWLVTGEIRRWCQISEDLKRRLPQLPRIKVISPIDLSRQEFSTCQGLRAQ
jgi:hypothetical protein